MNFNGLKMSSDESYISLTLEQAQTTLTTLGTSEMLGFPSEENNLIEEIKQTVATIAWPSNSGVLLTQKQALEVRKALFFHESLLEETFFEAESALTDYLESQGASLMVINKGSLGPKLPSPTNE
jgi:hypothetical protein